MKRKRYNKRAKKKQTQVQFAWRDVCDMMVIVLLLSVIVYFSHYMRNNHLNIPVWPQIKTVQVSGVLHVTDRVTFENIIQKHTAGGFFHVQMGLLEEELTGLPWVYRASVQRLWPNTLAVKVIEQHPIARWGDSGLMNAYGEVFFPSTTEPYASFPMLFGEEIRSKDLATVFENSLKQLQPLGLQLRGLFEDERQSKHLVLSNGLVLAIGDGNVVKKIARFITAYQQYLSPYLSEVEKIDLRYTNGLAVEWKNPQLANNIELERKL